MNDDRSSAVNGHKSWLERLSLALLGEPEDQDALMEMLRDAQQRNILDADALGMMEGVLQVSEMPVREIMIPRSQMVVIEQDWPLERVLSQVIESGHSRFPVIDEDRDDVVGILIVKDLLRYFAEGTTGELNLRDILRPAKYIPESKRLNVLLKDFRITHLHMAIVVDEYGGVAGLVTIEDVLEQIVGEIDDEHDDDEEEAFIRRLEDRRYTIKALTPVEDFNEYFNADLDEERADTVGGLVIMELGRLPERGELVTIDGYRLRVLRADNRRVHMLELTLSHTAETPPFPATDV